MDIKEFKGEMKKIRAPLQKAVGHARRERHSKAKSDALKKKMEPVKITATTPYAFKDGKY